MDIDFDVQFRIEGQVVPIDVFEFIQVDEGGRWEWEGGIKEERDGDGTKGRITMLAGIRRIGMVHEKRDYPDKTECGNDGIERSIDPEQEETGGEWRKNTEKKKIETINGGGMVRQAGGSLRDVKA
jgi:hypothetical protein